MQVKDKKLGGVGELWNVLDNPVRVIGLVETKDENVVMWSDLSFDQGEP